MTVACIYATDAFLCCRLILRFVLGVVHLLDFKRRQMSTAWGRCVSFASVYHLAPYTGMFC